MTLTECDNQKPSCWPRSPTSKFISHAAAAEPAASGKLKIMGHFTKCPEDPWTFAQRDRSCSDLWRHQMEEPRPSLPCQQPAPGGTFLTLPDGKALRYLKSSCQCSSTVHLATYPQSIWTIMRPDFKCNYLKYQRFTYNNCHFRLPIHFIVGDRSWIFHWNAGGTVGTQSYRDG